MHKHAPVHLVRPQTPLGEITALAQNPYLEGDRPTAKGDGREGGKRRGGGIEEGKGRKGGKNVAFHHLLLSNLTTGCI